MTDTTQFKTEDEWYHYYRWEKGYNRAQARNNAKRRYMTSVINNLKQNDPETYAKLQQKVSEEEVAERRRQQEIDDYNRRQEEMRRNGRVRLETALMCSGTPLPAINLNPPEVDIDEVLFEGAGRDEAVVSFRKWNFCTDGYLHGIGVGSRYAWQSLNTADVTPTPFNDHGLYSIRLDPHGLVTNAGNYVGEYCGLLELRGKIIEHGDGVMRAERARILCIWVTRCEPDIFNSIPTLMKNYSGVPVFPCCRHQVADALFRVTALIGMGR